MVSYRHVITDSRKLDNPGDGHTLQHSHSDGIVTDGLTPYETRLALMADRFSTS